ncbi:hypothetical protein OG871_17045 [Kitasatospora sp. NBC_00374]|uniref:hypothetical protein n=1 Tax=Kitasatospora sp. NBC_00374 TaxID=2975964 RepID=UPI0030E568BC
MPDFGTNTLAVTDDDYDRSRASDGHSRYGAYLAQRAHLLRDGDRPLTPVEFASAAWTTATSPIMYPGYVRTRPDLADLTTVITDDYRLALRITIPLRHHALTHRPARVLDWQTQHDPWSDARWTALEAPEQGDRPALLTTATLHLPVPERILVTPTAARPGPVMTREAKAAVRALAGYANAHAHLVADLTGGTR